MPRRILGNPGPLVLVLLLGTSGGLRASEGQEPVGWWSLWDALWLEEGFALGRTLLDRLEPDEQTGDFADALRRSTGDLDLGRLYKKLGREPGARRIVLAGARQDAAYRIRRVPERPALGAALGCFVAELELRPDELAGIPGEGFEAGVWLELQLGSMSWPRVRELAAGSTELARLRRDLPRSFELLDTLVAWEDLAGPGSRRLHWRMRLKPEGFEGRWPRIGRFAARLGELLVVESEIRTPSGRELWRLSAQDGTLSVEQVSDPERLMLLETEVGLSDRGLRTHVGPIDLPMEWKSDGAAAELHASLERPPPIELAGNALYVIPTSVIDVFIPGSIESLSRDFSAALARSGAGPGWKVNWRHDGGVVQLQARGKILDNGVIQLGAGLVNRRLRLGEEARMEALGLARELLGRLEADWRASLERR